MLDLFNHKPDGAVLSRFQYTYDSRGRRDTMTTTYGAGDPRTSLAGLWRYDYDDTGQLIGWTAPWGRRVDYTYDALGNRLNVRDNGTNTAYTVNNLNQYTQVGSTTYQYDADGNLTNKVAPEGATKFSWWFDNKLLSASGPEGIWENYYDALGHRVRASEKGLLKEFTHDALSFGLVAGEYAQGNQIGRYFRGVGLVSKTDASSKQFFYAFDPTGSTTEMLDDAMSLPKKSLESAFAPAIVNSYLGAPFGLPVVMNETLSNPYTFGGQFGTIVQQGSIMLAGYAPYSPDLGRFATPSLAMANLYRFVPSIPGTPPILPPVGSPGDLPIHPSRGPGGGGGSGGGGDGPPPDDDGDPDLCQPNDEVPCYDPIKGKWGCCPKSGTDEPPAICKKDEERYYDPVENKFKCRKKRPGPPTPPPPQPPLPPDWCDQNPDLCQCFLIPPMCTPVPPTPPFDPNSLTGPKGFGYANYVSINALFSYRVEFENATNALVPAQRVVVSNPADEPAGLDHV